MPKPLTSGALTLGEVYGSVAQDLMTRIGDAQAAQAGPPIADDIVPATDNDRVEAWNARRPEATDQAMMALAQQKYAEHRRAGMDDEKAQAATAEDLTHFRYGQRMKLYTYGQVDFKAQVTEAKRLAKLAARDSTPEPEPAPPSTESMVGVPSMPSAGLANAAPSPPPSANLPPLSANLPPVPADPRTPPAPGGY